MRLLIALLFAALLSPQSIIIAKKKAGGGGTIGYNTIGANTGATWDNTLAAASKFTAPANGSNGTFFVYCVSSSGSTVPVAVGVYADNAGVPGARLTAGTETVTCPSGGSGAAWVSTSITWPSIVSGTSYWLAIQTTNGTVVNFRRDAGDSGQESYTVATWAGALPDPWSSSGIESFKLSVYVTY
jgi:hypothetical protein